MMTKPMRKGDLVEVRSPEEILATLDPNGELDALPFMPEMADFCGKRFRVAAVIREGLRHHLLRRQSPDGRHRAP